MSSVPQDIRIGTIQRPFVGRLIWYCGAYLLFAVAAELLSALADLWLGLAVHALLLLVLTLHAGLGRNTESRKLALALMLAPLLRILSLALPLANLPRLAWYPIVLAPLLLSALLIIRQLHMSRAELGLRPGSPLLQFMLMSGGLGVGAAEYALLGPPQLLVAFSWNALLLLAIVLLIFTGFFEELIFRGLLQSVALPAMGRWALLYVSLLFAAMHIGYLSASAVAFALALGLIFAYAARWSGSIVGVGLAHGLANVTLFILMPFLAEASGHTVIVAHSAIAAGTTLAGVAMAILMVRAFLLGRAARSIKPVTKQFPGNGSGVIVSSSRGSGAPQALLGEDRPIVVKMPLALPAPPTNSTVDRMPVVPALRSIPRGLDVAPKQIGQSQKLLFNALLARLALPRNYKSQVVPAAPMIRALRRAAGLTYVELALRTQLPARLIAEIEHGLRVPNHNQLGLIFQVLGIDIDLLVPATVSAFSGLRKGA
jgi:membrane protease YdiL (CAAX protease family)